MAPPRRSRVSVGTNPWLSSPAEQKVFYEEAQRDPEIRETIERITGVDFDNLTYQEFRTAYTAWVSSGFAKAEFVAIARADRLLREEGARLAGRESLEDQVARLTVENLTQKQQFEAEIARITERFGLSEATTPTKKEEVRA